MPTKPDLLMHVRDILDERVATTVQDDQLVRWLNLANRDLARSTQHYQGTSSITMISGTAEYTLASTILQVELAYYYDGSSYTPLVARQYENMDQYWGDRQNTSGRPALFTTWGYSPNMKIRFFPVPTSNTDTVSLLTRKLPADLPSDNTTAVDVPTAWWDALVDYCEWYALRKDRDPRWQEARQEYMRKRDDLIVNGGSLAVNHEITPDPVRGWLPTWLVEFD